MVTWYYISVFIHIICAAFWIGGMLFLPLVMLPALKNTSYRIDVLYNTGVKFRYYGWIMMTLLIITGVSNVYLRGFNLSIKFLAGTSYGKSLSLKLLLFAIMLMVSAVHDLYLGNRALDEMKEKPDACLKKIARWTGRINMLLSLAIAFIGIVLSRGGF